MNLSRMLARPRYFVGRQVLAKLPVKSNIPGSNDFMEPTHGSSEPFVTHKARITAIDGNVATLNNEFRVPLNDLMTLNSPHIFAKTVTGALQFEDGLVCDYGSTDFQHKMLEILVELRPFVKRLDFAEDPLPIQLECIRVIRRTLDFITFDQGDEKTVHGDRARTGDVGKLGMHGQGNCHGSASVMAAYLLPFSELLGFDVKYRGGYSFSGIGDTVNNDIERHQWVEVTCRPSMETYCVDLQFEGALENDKYVCWSATECYSTSMYPNGKLIIGTTVDRSADPSSEDMPIIEIRQAVE